MPSNQSIRFPFTGLGVTFDITSNYLIFYNNKSEPIAYWEFMKNPWKKESDTKNGWRQIGGTRIRIQKKPVWRSYKYPVENLKMAFDYVRDLFRLPITRYLLSYNNKNLSPQYLNIKKCDELRIDTCRKISVDEMKYVLEEMEISKKLTLCLERYYEFKYDFIRFSVDELTINYAFWITKETFLAMDCARITLERNKNLPIREFVSQWLLSRNTRFEWLKMHRNLEQINWNEGFEPLKWNPAIRGRYFKINSFQSVDCEKGIDFLREDGMLATVVKAEMGLIYFIVWHKRFQP
uniref:FBA_2 domain-containing protein n=1 Tax=Caenorhabditis tropicalis TaxID=1561998 RepID=A0A1I7UIB6_9PELO